MVAVPNQPQTLKKVLKESMCFCTHSVWKLSV